MYGYKLHGYVPEPQPVRSDYTILAHYYPGWKREPGAPHNGFFDLHDYPERTPLLGYYDETSPEVFDWQIKWAVEHGINCFVHCWYRKRENVGSPLTDADIRFGHSISDGFFRARYKNYMQFAIMWECDWGRAKDQNDLTENLIPYWAEHYFSDPTYLKIGGAPVVFIYGVTKMIREIGGVEAAKEAVAAAKEKMRSLGFTGIHFSSLHSAPDLDETNDFWFSLNTHKAIGFDSTFQYNWGIRTKEDLTEAQYADYLRNGCMLPADTVIAFVEKQIERRIAYDPDFCIFTVNSMLDSKPWFEIFHLDPKGPYAQFHLTPTEWKRELEMVKAKLDTLPDGCLSKRFILLDNWNEWGEGHYICPSLGSGFQYLEAVRDVLTKRDNLPDYRLPETLELGPYDVMWRKNDGI